MGYTHYWNLDTTKVTATDIHLAVTAVHNFICAAFPGYGEVGGIKLADGFGEGLPEFGWNDRTGTHFSLNGGGDDAFETFMFPPGGSLSAAIENGNDTSYGNSGNGIAKDFCKTGHRKYDLVVTACLTIIKDALPAGSFNVASDGSTQAFYAGAMLAASVCDKPMAHPFDDATAFCTGAIESDWPHAETFGASPDCFLRAKIIAAARSIVIAETAANPRFVDLQEVE